jgi:hypothetical protein
MKEEEIDNLWKLYREFCLSCNQANTVPFASEFLAWLEKYRLTEKGCDHTEEVETVAGNLYCVSCGYKLTSQPNTTMQYIQQREREFEEKFDGVLEKKFITEDPRVPPITIFVKDDLKSFHRQSLLGLIEEVEKKIEGMKWKVLLEGPQVRELHYNSALSDLLNYLQEIKK